MLEQIEEFITSRLTGVFQGDNYNQFSTKPVEEELSVESAEKFNEIYFKLKESDLNKIERTNSGAIMNGLAANDYAYDIAYSRIGLRLTIILAGTVYVYKIGSFKGHKEQVIYPDKAFQLFSNKCLEYNVDLDNYIIDNGKKVKETIEKPQI